MFVTITNDHTNEILLQRELGDEESLDPLTYADELASVFTEANGDEFAVDRGEGAVPLGCGDFTVELADHPLSGACWTARSYFWRTETWDERCDREARTPGTQCWAETQGDNHD